MSMDVKRVIIVGDTGQDGTLLKKDLQQQGLDVVGISRSKGLQSSAPVPEVEGDITNLDDVRSLVRFFQPHEIYYLAAHHTSSESTGSLPTLREQFESAQATHVTGLLHYLSAITESCIFARLFYASSSLVFSGENGAIQTEVTPLNPQGVYGITKAQGMWLCREFRNQYNVFASVGILYNHESHLRPSSFLSAKIIRTAIRIAEGSEEKLEIGNLSGMVDWGYARDYVSAFQRILSVDIPGDFIVATGEAHTVQEFIEIVFDYFDIKFEKSVIENKTILSRSPLVKIGDAGKLRKTTGWKPSLAFREFVILLIVDHLTALGGRTGIRL
jgi:GDPmannose 4,6-dehydratase